MSRGNICELFGYKKVRQNYRRKAQEDGNMKITAINGSPRKNGRISKIVDEMIKGAEENGHKCEKIYLVDLNIKDCTGCMSCQEKGACVFRDDIEKIEEAIKISDLIIWASPTHWANVSGLLLRVFERLFGFLIKEQPKRPPLKRNAKGKKAILVTACSTARPFNWIYNQSRSCISRMHEICKWSGQEISGTFVLPGSLTMKDIPEKYLKKAREVGRRIK